MEITSGDMPMLSDLQLVYMVPRNSTQLLKINTTKFQVEREPVYPSRYAVSMVARASSSLGVTCLGDPLEKLEYLTRACRIQINPSPAVGVISRK